MQVTSRPPSRRHLTPQGRVSYTYFVIHTAMAALLTPHHAPRDEGAKQPNAYTGTIVAHLVSTTIKLRACPSEPVVVPRHPYGDQKHDMPRLRQIRDSKTQFSYHHQHKTERCKTRQGNASARAEKNITPVTEAHGGSPRAT